MLEPRARLAPVALLRRPVWVLLRRPVKVAREVLDAAARPAGEAPAEAMSASGIVDELLGRLGTSHPSVRRRG